MMTDPQTHTCHKRARVLVDAYVRATMQCAWRRRHLTETEYANVLDKEIEEFADFLRDHRSQDRISLAVVRDYKDLCSNCGKEWEPGSDVMKGQWYCQHCGATVVDDDAQEEGG